jgi:hypothetical protein
VKERRVELASHLRLDIERHVDAGRAQSLGAAGCCGRRIAGRSDDARDAGGDERIDAGWRLSEMGAGFERDIHRRTTGALARRA